MSLKQNNGPTTYSKFVSAVSSDSNKLQLNIDSIEPVITEAKANIQDIQQMEIECFDKSKLDDNLKLIYERHLQSIDSTYKLLIQHIRIDKQDLLIFSFKKQNLDDRIFMTIQTEEMKSKMKSKVTDIENMIAKIDNLLESLPKPQSYNFNTFFSLTGERREEYAKLYNDTIPHLKHILSMAKEKFQILLDNKQNYEPFSENEPVYTYNHEILKEFFKSFKSVLEGKGIQLDDYKEGSDKNPLITSSGGKRRKSKSRKSRKGRKKSRKSRRR